MTNEIFLDKWQSISNDHVFLDRSIPSNLGLESTTLDFLFDFGMLSEFRELNFDYLKKGIIETVNQKLGLDKPRLDNYFAIGFNSSGDPICINGNNQELIYLNHDNDFQEIFINSNLRKFAQSVLIMHEFIGQINKLTPDSFFETEFSDKSYNDLVNEMKLIDPNIFQTDHNHWTSVLEYMKWERDEERRN